MSRRTSPSGRRTLVLVLTMLSALAARAPAGQDTGAGAAAGAPQAAPGERVPEHTFREFLAGGDGRQKLSEFRGQPVLIVNWTDTDFGLGAARKARALAFGERRLADIAALAAGS